MIMVDTRKFRDEETVEGLTRYSQSFSMIPIETYTETDLRNED